MKYDFKVNEAISLLQHETKQFITDLFEKCLKYRVKVADVTVFVNAKIKIYYNARHQSLMLKFENRVYLRLNQKYHLSGKFNKKISLQRCGSFLIKKRIERLAYLLKLFFKWRIHSIIFVTQLKPASFTEDFYHRLRSNHSDVINIEEDTSQWRFYEMKRIIDKRMRIYNNKKIVQYLLRWKEYDSEWNEWRNIIKLNNCMNLIENYENKFVVIETFNRAFKLIGRVIRTTFIKSMIVISSRTEILAASSNISSIITFIISTLSIISVISGLRRSNRLRH